VQYYKLTPRPQFEEDQPPTLEDMVNNLKKGVTSPTKKASGAGNGVRTRDTKLGKLVLYQLSYARPESNLPLETHSVQDILGKQ
jgi:hypothetical protein